MKMPSMFTKLAGAVATSVILAGAPGAATAGIERVGEAKIEALAEIDLNKADKDNTDNINKKLSILNLPVINVNSKRGLEYGAEYTGEVLFKIDLYNTVKPFEMEVTEDGVAKKKTFNSTLISILEDKCGVSDFTNKYKFEEKFMSKIVEQVKLRAKQIEDSKKK